MTDILDPQAIANDLAARDPEFAVKARRVGEQMPIQMITVTDRHRADLGDIAMLAKSIRENGLIQPIVLNSVHRLIAGQRRLEACKSLGWTQIPVYVVGDVLDAADLLRMERDENTCRKSMTPSELVAMGKKLEELERPKAAERQSEAGRQFGRGKTSDSSGSPEPKLSEHNRVRKVVADAIGMSTGTYYRAKSIVEAAANPDQPETVRAAAAIAVAEMDKGAPIVPLHLAVEKAKDEADPGRATGPRARRKTVPPAPTTYGPRRKHNEKLSAIVTGLSGYQIVLDEISALGQLDASIGNEEAARLEGGFFQAISAINRVRNLLKERTNAQP